MNEYERITNGWHVITPKGHVRCDTREEAMRLSGHYAVLTAGHAEQRYEPCFSDIDPTCRQMTDAYIARSRVR